MKFIFLFILIFPFSSHASDGFISGANPHWKFAGKINNTVVQSKFNISPTKFAILRTTYKNTVEKFEEFWKINKSFCGNNQLTIRIISEKDLDNRLYFPNETTYSRGQEVVVGRYFRGTHIIYIVPPNLDEYYWRENVAHEMTHYLFDDCGMKFYNDDEEHKNLNKFINHYKHLFY